MTHEHADHLDPDAVPVIARNNPRCRFAGPAGCADGLAQAGVAPDRQVLLGPNQSYDLGGVIVHTAPADHGDLSRSALTLVLDFDGVRVWVTGDTSLRLDLFEPMLELKPDVVLPCINGGYGNMMPLEAARLVQRARPRFAIPCHFWMFAGQGVGDPGTFLQACKQLCPEVNAFVLGPGEGFTVNRRVTP
jgi:L-ascorbate 6-phosphate lactonase